MDTAARASCSFETGACCPSPDGGGAVSDKRCVTCKQFVAKTQDSYRGDPYTCKRFRMLMDGHARACAFYTSKDKPPEQGRML